MFPAAPTIGNAYFATVANVCNVDPVVAADEAADEANNELPPDA